MSGRDPFDRVRRSNPVDPKRLPAAPLGMAARIMAEKPRRFRLTGPALGLASMAFVLVVGALTTTLMLGGTDEPVISQASTTTINQSTVPATDQESTTTTVDPGTASTGGVAPWSAPTLPESAVPRHLIEDWAKAENQMWCSALYPADPAALGADGVSRSAYFAGGWAVGWDLPDGPGRDAADGYCPDCGRSAYGIAGAGLTGTEDALAVWPSQIGWDDGSLAGFGLEGLQEPGSGAPALAYLVIEGQGCLYNVWSFLGEDHLLDLLDSLRFVEGLQARSVQLVDRTNQETRDLGDAPWQQPALADSGVPAVFFQEWAEDLGSTACPMMAFDDLGPEGIGSTARRAAGDSALLVAWDLPDGPGRYPSGEYCADCGRGAFGTSLEAQEGFFQQEWSPTVRFTDGSRVWITPELSIDLPDDRIVHRDPQTGDLAPEPYLALIEIAEHPDCLYQVWSSFGPDHVEYLVSNLRYVENKTGR